ncbi:hypothetical protein TRFO_08686 [Tritrichomonas foetus]|uniref:Uncharacterized protein n=1 Tax=Tritrichomonas foetus TaxID=1144522 RepID=A0A1J4JME2_9EUKA|nr:hypothetical protein TRFO_08686 [Tritrichomonas foetus]|eukprot:OHS98709.1 hypothetical protein TRFO_08686 [Tritrichomonas foetus]
MRSLSTLILSSLSTCFTNGCWRSMSIVGLCFGSTTMHLLTKSWKTPDSLFPCLNPGNPCWRIACIACVALYSQYGGPPSASSTAVVPTLQISAGKVYFWFSIMTSGAIQYGVPIVETVENVVASTANCLETPKSVSLSSPFVLAKILAALMSRCTILNFLWRRLRAIKRSCITKAI